MGIQKSCLKYFHGHCVLHNQSLLEVGLLGLLYVEDTIKIQTYPHAAMGVKLRFHEKYEF